MRSIPSLLLVRIATPVPVFLVTNLSYSLANCQWWIKINLRIQKAQSCWIYAVRWEPKWACVHLHWSVVFTNENVAIKIVLISPEQHHSRARQSTSFAMIFWLILVLDIKQHSLSVILRTEKKIGLAILQEATMIRHSRICYCNIVNTAVQVCLDVK